jgi:hypothetical protein
MENSQSHNTLQKAALAIAIIGAVASLMLVFYAGRNNNSIILRMLFIGWVLSPFAALIAANVSKRLANANTVLLYWLTIVIAILSLVLYSGILSPPGTKLTPFFLFVPLSAWVIITVFILSVLKSRR